VPDSSVSSALARLSQAAPSAPADQPVETAPRVCEWRRGASTHKLTGGLFEYEDLGLVEAKGFAERVHAWRVRGESAAESRFEALRGGAETPALVGREESRCANDRSPVDPSR
jgi:hypothetical protein